MASKKNNKRMQSLGRLSFYLEPLEQRVMLSTTQLTPAQIRHAYGFDQTYFTVNGKTVADNGAGETIAIVDAYGDPTIAADLKSFDATYGLANPNFKTVQMGGSVSTNASWSLETSLDVEWAHAVAPGANIVLVEAKSASMTDLMAAVNYAKNLSGVVSVSMSWGASEFTSETSLDSSFSKAGVTFVASSGDNGSGTNYPAASKNVLSVGGTTLSVDNAGNYQGETAWSGSGGGYSAIEGNNVPDVSYDADPSTGYMVYDTTKYENYSGWWVVGGTSAGSPQWAGLIADADQGRALRGEAALSSAQTISDLFSLPSSDFHDITSGSNGGYSAGTGYDLVTGLGTPIVQNIVDGLVGGNVTTNASGTPVSGVVSTTSTTTTTTKTATAKKAAAKATKATKAVEAHTQYVAVAATGGVSHVGLSYFDRQVNWS